MTCECWKRYVKQQVCRTLVLGIVQTLQYCVISTGLFILPLLERAESSKASPLGRQAYKYKPVTRSKIKTSERKSKQALHAPPKLAFSKHKNTACHVTPTLQLQCSIHATCTDRCKNGTQSAAKLEAMTRRAKSMHLWTKAFHSVSRQWMESKTNRCFPPFGNQIWRSVVSRG